MQDRMKEKLHLVDRLTKDIQMIMNDLQGDKIDEIRKRLTDISRDIRDLLADSCSPATCRCSAGEPVLRDGFCFQVSGFSPKLQQLQIGPFCEMDTNNLSQKAVFSSYAEHGILGETLRIMVEVLQTCIVCSSKNHKKTANMRVIKTLEKTTKAAGKVRVEAEKIPVAKVLPENIKPRSPYYGGQEEKIPIANNRFCDF
ncbi:MAG: hypothetical protein WCO89_07190 [Syntrophus sp. (in: bacteria)]